MVIECWPFLLFVRFFFMSSVGHNVICRLWKKSVVFFKFKIYWFIVYGTSTLRVPQFINLVIIIMINLLCSIFPWCVGHAYLPCREDLSYFSCTIFIINIPFVSDKTNAFSLQQIVFLPFFQLKKVDLSL